MQETNTLFPAREIWFEKGRQILCFQPLRQLAASEQNLLGKKTEQSQSWEMLSWEKFDQDGKMEIVSGMIVCQNLEKWELFWF